MVSPDFGCHFISRFSSQPTAVSRTSAKAVSGKHQGAGTDRVDVESVIGLENQIADTARQTEVCKLENVQDVADGS